jgi:hypothetical protein
MEYKIDGRMIFLVFIMLFLAISFYSIIEMQERPHSKTEVSRIIREKFFKNKPVYQKLVSFALNINSYSTEWHFETVSDNKFQYYSETPFDSCKISLKEYKTKYYKNIVPETSPSLVPDFDIPAVFNETLDSLLVSSFLYTKEEANCGKRNICFKFKRDLFNPEGRVVQFRYFPEGMCKEIIKKIKESDNKWNWIIYLDNNWIAESIMKGHYGI